MEGNNASVKGITVTEERSRSGTTAVVSQDDDVDPAPPQVGYTPSILLSLIFYPLAAIPLFLGFLAAYWFQPQWVWLTCWKCPLDRAIFVVAKGIDKKYYAHYVRSFTIDIGGWRATTRYIIHSSLRYLFDEKQGKFCLLRGYDQDITCLSIHDMINGLSDDNHTERLIKYGPNTIDVPVKPYYILFIEEVLHPFYLAVIFSVCLWIYQVYYYYSVAIFLISMVSALTSLFLTRRNLQQLHDIVKHSSLVTVFRSGRELFDVPSESLVPGDILVIPSTGMTMPCDAALLTGTAIVNEASLTGESIPVTKTQLPQSQDMYRPDRFKRHTLFGGTHVIQTRFYSNSKVLAVVVNTSFLTSKGNMVRSILYPKPLTLKFYADAFKFLGFLSLLGLFGFIYTVVLDAEPLGPSQTIVNGFNIVTTIIPPALVAALTVGQVYAVFRLKRHQIYCISPQRVNLCGKIKCVCFDKTGTLTEESLNMKKVVMVQDGVFLPSTDNPASLPHGILLHAMATCHSLTIINKELVGDPLDVKMFNSTGWSLEEPGEDSSKFDVVAPTIVRSQSSGDCVELGIIRQFTFSSELQRMSVLVRNLASKDSKTVLVYAKGAPEKIAELCRPETVPQDFHRILRSLTEDGLRVIAVGHRTMQLSWHKSERIEREDVEHDLIFGGLIAMENTLKPETTPVIKILKNANIRTVMITGDNVLTAVSVARICQIINPWSNVVLVKAESGSDQIPLVSYELLEEAGKSGSSEEFASVVVPFDGDFSDTDKQVKPEIRKKDVQLVIEGATFKVIRAHHPDLLPKLMVKGAVFARMSPDQKAEVVVDLQKLGYSVCMCGDGANDCGALKAAQAGISLSEAEASVASPFTSKVPNITCVVKLLREGRAALATSFMTFHFMAVYSLAEFTAVAILYYSYAGLTQNEYLWIDLFIVLPLSYSMGINGPYHELARRRPPGRLAGPDGIVSMGLRIIGIVGFQLAGVFYLENRQWYTPVTAAEQVANGYYVQNTPLNTVVFNIASSQVIAMAINLSVGPPYRTRFFHNVPTIIVLFILVPCNIFIILAPYNWYPYLWDVVLEVDPLPYLLFRVGILLIVATYFFLFYLLEGFVFDKKWFHSAVSVLRCKRQPNNPYKRILANLDPMWPLEGRQSAAVYPPEGRQTAFTNPRQEVYGPKMTTTAV